MIDTANAESAGQSPNEFRAQSAGAWRLMWWKFRKHKLALGSGFVVIFIYLIAAFAEFIALAFSYSALYPVDIVLIG